MYSWRFFKASRLLQAKIETGDDLAHLKALDRKLWTVLASPVQGLRFDARTLAFLDSDGDGRIRADEVCAAVDWLAANGIALQDCCTENAADEAALADVTRRQAELDAQPPSGVDKLALDAWIAAEPAVFPDRTPPNLDTAASAANAAAEAAFAAVEAKLDAFFAVPDDLPLVTDAADVTLPLDRNLNPAWEDAIAAFAETVVKPLLGAEKTELSRADWKRVKAAFAPYRTWRAAKPVAAAALKAELETEEKKLRLKRGLVPFIRNFVNQADLYDLSRQTVYQTGALYVAGRMCNLCFHVEAEAAHAALAEKSKCCLLYAKLMRKDAPGARTICAVVTAGATVPLFAGRNGVFYDRDGSEWDATITKVVEGPTSLREAFWAPWRKLGDAVAAQVKKFVAGRQEAATAGLSKTVENAGAAKPADNGANAAALASSVAALGVGVGMMGAALAGLIGLVAGLPAWKTACAVLAVLLAVSLPSVVLTWFKLRARDLGVILNAGGWAVNRPLRFSMKLARRFTETSFRKISA